MKIHHFILSIACVSLLVSGCRKDPEQAVEKDFISFTKPHGWLMQDITQEDDKHKSVLLRKQGMFSSGFITITLAEEDIEPEVWILEQRDSLDRGDVFSFTDENFTMTGPAEYGIYKSESAEFTQVYFGADYIGAVHAIKQDGYSVLILEAGSVPDREMNEAGFQIIRESFRIGQQR